VAYSNVTPGLTSKNGVLYNLQYDPTTGGGQIIQQNAPPGTKPIYENGKWNASATTLGFTDSEKIQLHQQSIASIQSAYNSIGGVSSGAKLGQWASVNFTTGQPGQTSVNPQASVSGTSGGNSAGGIEELTKYLQNPAESYKNFSSNGDKFGVGNEKRLYAGGMKYPLDLMSDQQDILVISQFEYVPSKGESIFGGTTAAINTLLNGLQTGSPIGLEKPLGTVFLPMPNSVSDNNSVAWGDDTMGNLAAAATAQTLGNLGGTAGIAALGAIVGGVTGTGFKEMAGKFLTANNLNQLMQKGGIGPEVAMLLGSEGVSKLLKMQGMPVEPESILARGAGIVPNSNLELLFQSPTLRKFSFTYRLSPRSAEEAKEVRRIIRFFKQGMAAKKMRGKSGAASFFLGTPNVFKLEYKSKKEPIDGVNKFKTCALTSFSCNYTPDGLWAAYDKGQPVSTIFNMSFDELEPIYDTDYQENNIFENRTDLSSISDNSVGY
jgi:hypothetical protein